MPMPDNQNQTNEIIFQKIDLHQVQLSELQTFKEVTNHRLANADRRHDEICDQLIRTEAKVMEKLGTQGQVIDDLYDDKLRKEGAKSQWKMIAAVIGVIYTCLQIYVVIAVAK